MELYWRIWWQIALIVIEQFIGTTTSGCLSAVNLTFLMQPKRDGFTRKQKPVIARQCCVEYEHSGITSLNGI